MIKPIGDKVLLENVVAEDAGMQGGIHIPQASQKKSEKFIVRAIGTGGKDGKGDEIVFPVEAGDEVLVTQFGGTEVKYDDKSYRIVSYLDILAKID